MVQVEGQGVRNTIKIEDKPKVGALFIPFWVEVWRDIIEMKCGDRVNYYISFGELAEVRADEIMIKSSIAVNVDAGPVFVWFERGYYERHFLTPSIQSFLSSFFWN